MNNNTIIITYDMLIWIAFIITLTAAPASTVFVNMFWRPVGIKFFMSCHNNFN